MLGGRHDDIPQSVCIADRIRNYIESYNNRAEISMEEDCKDKALELYQRVRSDGGLMINGLDPRGIAGALIWMAAIMTESRIYQTDIAKTLGISVRSMRSKLPKLKIIL
jgi:transcription initiation factor TFIIIB Brf1 subunit/transcription initiation factor TFIIB